MLSQSYHLIIVTYNSSSTIGDCLKSVLISAAGHEVEVVVVDNASPDQTKKIVKEQFPQVRLIENASNVGFAAAVNQGADTSKASYLVLLNPDTKVEEKFFQKLSDFFRANPNAAVAGCRLVDAKGERQSSCWKTPTLGTTLLEMFLPYKLSIELITDNPAVTSEVSMVSGACMAIRRELFERFQGLDKGFFMYYEDSDLCYRIRKDGYHIFFHAAINVYHKISGSGGNREILTMQYYRSKLLFFRKHYSRSYAFLVYMIILAGIVLRIPAYWIMGILSFNRKLVELGRLYTYVARNAWKIGRT